MSELKFHNCKSLTNLQYLVNISSVFVNRESGNPVQKHWIPPYQVRGRLSQARNDKQSKGTFDALH